MKGKEHWKPVGLDAKKWHNAGHTGKPAKPIPAAAKNEPLRKRTEKRFPSVPNTA